ncbi:MAG: putative porin [Bacteroidota bacterium]|nr:putative porin [Bacteroidota bacterium]
MRKSILSGIFVISAFIFGSNIWAASVNDSIPSIIKIWQIDDEYLGIDSLEFDTGLTNFQLYNPIFKKEILPTHLGNEGSPFKSNIIADIELSFPFFQFSPYFFEPRNVKFYNTRKPLTRIDYVNGGGKNVSSQFINIYHTQNINPNFNAGFRVFMIHALGDYANEETKNNSFGFWTSYEKEQYAIFSSFNYNKYKLLENGGFINDSTFDNNSFTDTRYIKTNLTNAKSTVRYHNFSLSHGISVGGWAKKQDSVLQESFFQKVKIWHNFKYERKNRVFQEEGDDVISHYQDIFTDSAITYDSTFYDSYFNSVSLRFIPGENIFSGISTGLFHLAEKYSAYSISESENNFGLIGSWTGYNSKRINWRITGKLYLAGYYGGDYSINADFKLVLTKDSLAPEIRFGGSISRKTPSLYYNNYSSNHFKWDTDLYQVFSEFARGELLWPKYSFKLKVQTGLFTNYIYFDDVAKPAQLSETAPILQFFVDKDFSFWNMHFRNELIFQKTPKDKVFAIPAFSYKSDLLLNSDLFKKALFVQVGIGLRYQSSYYAMAYMPATGVFYSQHEKEIGNYPFLNVFLNAKIKQVRLFFKYEHINQGLINNSYYSTFHYPVKPRRFVFGLSWLFYS